MRASMRASSTDAPTSGEGRQAAPQREMGFLEQVLLQGGIRFVVAGQPHQRSRVFGGYAFTERITARIGRVHRGSGAVNLGIRSAHAEVVAAQYENLQP